MPDHTGINLNQGLQAFTQSVQNIKRDHGVDAQVKIYGTPLKDKDGNVQTDDKGRVRYSTYASSKGKGWLFGASKRQSNKTEGAKAAFTQFIDDVAKQHGLTKDQKLDLSVLVAKIGSDSKNAFKHIQDLDLKLREMTQEDHSWSKEDSFRKDWHQRDREQIGPSANGWREQFTSKYKEQQQDRRLERLLMSTVSNDSEEVKKLTRHILKN